MSDKRSNPHSLTPVILVISLENSWICKLLREKKQQDGRDKVLHAVTEHPH